MSFNSYIQLSCWRDKQQDQSQWVNNEEKELYSSIRKNFLRIGAVKQAEQREWLPYGMEEPHREATKYLFEMLLGSDTQAWASRVSDVIICSNLRICISNKCPEKTMAPHSSTLAWKIPWVEEPGRLQSMGSLRVRHDWATSLSLFTFTHWRRKWQPTPVFLPGESQGQGSLVGCCLWGRTKSDTTEAT